MTEASASRRRGSRTPRACVWRVAVTLALGVTRVEAGIDAPPAGKTVQFNPAFLPGGDAMKIDLSRYTRGNPVMAGTYDADVWLNGEWQWRRRVRFATEDTASDAIPCVSRADLVSLGVTLPASDATDDEGCRPLSDHLPGATTRFDVSQQRLDIEVPQASRARRRFDLVPPAQRDAGVVSGQLGWHANLHRNTMGKHSRTARFLALEAGINAGNWRARGAGAWSASRYRRRYLYVERQIEAWRSQWRVGELLVSDGSFAPVRLYGMSLASDARMEDDAGSGYKPRVRGVARTHAVVRVSQAGVLLRELSVTPGPFMIDDLQGIGRAGHLDVTVDEEDGARTSFRVPFFAMPDLLGEGLTSASMSVGRAVTARGRGGDLVQATWRRGLPRDTTVYSGWRGWAGSHSILLGAAVDTLAGAFAVDFTGSRTARFSSFSRPIRSRAWRVRHGRRWHDGTSMWVSLSRERGGVLPGTGHRRSSAQVGDAGDERLDIVLQHELPAGNGSLTASGDLRRTERSFAFAWTRAWRRATLDVSLRHAADDVGARLGVSIPWDSAPTAPTLTLAGQGARHDASRLQLGVVGTTGREREVGYGAFLAQGAGGDRAIGLSASRLSGGGESSVAVDRSRGARAESFATSGGLVLHRDGITRAQRLGETMALVHAPGAAGARLSSATGVRLDRRGYGVAPHLAPFRRNPIEIDPAGLSLDVSLLSTRRSVAPTAGALVLLPFDTDVGRTALLVARQADGAPPPFGADVLDSEGRSVGVVGQAGNIFVRNVVPGAALTVRWGKRTQDQCIVRMEADGEAAPGLTRLTGVCQ